LRCATTATPQEANRRIASLGSRHAYEQIASAAFPKGPSIPKRSNHIMLDGFKAHR